MRKVCILTSVHPVFDTRIFHKEAKTLSKIGYDITLIAQHNKNETVDRIRIIALPEPKNRIFRILFLTKKLYKIALEQKADIYHFHDPEFLPWAVKLKKKTGAKVIYDVHEDVPQQILSKGWIPKVLRKPIAIFLNFYEKRKAKKLDFIIAALSKIKENFKERGITNIEIVTNYPILEYFPTAKQKIKKEENRKNLIYVGDITRIRGIIQLVKSLKFIKDKTIKLILIGRFSDKGLGEEIKKIPEWKRIEFKGWLQQKDAYQAMMNADIGLICFLPAPNHINAIPNKLFEYMAAGLPVVASNFPLWREIVEKNKCGICVNPLGPKEIARTIEYLIAHPKEAKKMGENGRKAVLEKYNWESESKKLLNIYKQLLYLS